MGGCPLQSNKSLKTSNLNSILIQLLPTEPDFKLKLIACLNLVIQSIIILAFGCGDSYSLEWKDCHCKYLQQAELCDACTSILHLSMIPYRISCDVMLSNPGSILNWIAFPQHKVFCYSLWVEVPHQTWFQKLLNAWPQQSTAHKTTIITATSSDKQYHHKARHVRLTAVPPQSPTRQTRGTTTKPNLSD